MAIRNSARNLSTRLIAKTGLNKGKRVVLFELTLIFVSLLFSSKIDYHIPATHNLPSSIFVGILSGAALFKLTVLFGLSSSGFMRNLQEFHEEYRGTNRCGRVVIKPLLIALGEELFFRGLLFSLFGFVACNTIFALVHTLVFIDKLLTFIHIFVFGSVFVLLTIWSNALLAPIICHWVFSVLRIYYFPEKLEIRVKRL